MFAFLLLPGCATHWDSPARLTPPLPIERESIPSQFMRNSYYYPVRDVFDPRIWPGLFNPDEPVARDLDEQGNVPDGAFFTNRPDEKISPQVAARGPATMPPPTGPWKIEKIKLSNDLVQFTGRDALGRKFLVKLDDPNYPHAGSGASVIADRIFWLLGYNVPANFAVKLEKTGQPQLDGAPAEAALFVGDSAAEHADIDSLRYRREIRALRIASAWLDDLDRVSNNTLLVKENGEYRFYLLDFNSCLGLWQGRPKDPWQGHRHIWDPNWGFVNLISFGALERSQISHRQNVSPAVGLFHGDDFAPLAWKTQQPNSPFRFMTRQDARWMARRIARISPEQLRTIVAAAGYPDPRDEEYVYQTLLARRQKIIDLLLD